MWRGAPPPPAGEPNSRRASLRHIACRRRGAAFAALPCPHPFATAQRPMAGGRAGGPVRAGSPDPHGGGGWVGISVEGPKVIGGARCASGLPGQRPGGSALKANLTAPPAARPPPASQALQLLPLQAVSPEAQAGPHCLWSRRPRQAGRLVAARAQRHAAGICAALALPLPGKPPVATCACCPTWSKSHAPPQLPHRTSAAQLSSRCSRGWRCVQVHLYPVTSSPEPGSAAAPFWPSADACHDGSPGYEASAPPPLCVLPGWLAGWLAGLLQQQEESTV